MDMPSKDRFLWHPLRHERKNQSDWGRYWRHASQPSLFQTTINTAVLNAWVDQDLLENLSAKGVVIMNHTTLHKGKEMEESVDKKSFFMSNLMVPH